MPSLQRWLVLGGLGVLALAGTACGDDSSDDDGTTETSTASTASTEPTTGTGSGSTASGEGGNGQGGIGQGSTGTGEGGEEPTSSSSSAGGTPITEGWTEFPEVAGAVIVHVSNDGSDAQPGTVEAPLATIAAGYALLRDGSADALLLRRGDVFDLDSTLMWDKSGPAEEGAGWMRLGAYGDAALPRPVLDGLGGVVLTPGYQASKVVQNVAFHDIHLLASERLASPESAPDANGLQLIAVEWQGSEGLPMRHILVENVRVEGFAFGIVTAADVEDFRLRRSVITEIFRPGGMGTHSSGILTAAQGLLLQENVFYRNQHPDMPGVTEASHFAHSAYITAEARNVACVDNYIVKATEGFMVRAGGLYARNVSAHSAIAGLLGQAYGVTPTPGGVDIEMIDNLLLNDDASFVFGNTRGGVSERNVAYRGPEGTVDFGFSLIPSDGANIGVQNATFRDNWLSGDLTYDAGDSAGLVLENNQANMGAGATTIASFLTAIGRQGATIDDWAEELRERDRGNFLDLHAPVLMIDHYRAAVGLPPVAP